MVIFLLYDSYSDERVSFPSSWFENQNTTIAVICVMMSLVWVLFGLHERWRRSLSGLQSVHKGYKEINVKLKREMTVKREQLMEAAQKSPTRPEEEEAIEVQEQMILIEYFLQQFTQLMLIQKSAQQPSEEKSSEKSIELVKIQSEPGPYQAW